VARCVLCGRSAGLFYRLHKACYAKHQSLSEQFYASISEQIEQQSTADLAAALQQSLLQHNFLVEPAKRALVRALEKFAEDQLNNQSTDALLQRWSDLLLRLALPENLFLSANFVSRQTALLGLKSLKQAQMPALNMSTDSFTETLAEDEELLYCFPKASLLKTQEQRAQWSLARQLFRGLLGNRTHSAVQEKQEIVITLWLSNQCLYFRGEGQHFELRLEQIFSLTPQPNGVMIQSKLAEAKPLILQDANGHLLYSFLKQIKERKDVSSP
tara:strand:- start:15575 stop:16387 length:813 start_codon:yes stop_codon:yes gene_type:complete